MGRVDGNGHAVGDLIPGDDAAQEIRTAQALGLGQGQHRRDHRCAGVVEAVTVNIVEFDGVRRRAINERGGARIGGVPGRIQQGLAGTVGKSLGQQRRRRLKPAPQRRGEPIDDGALGGVDGVFRQIGDRQPGGVIGETLKCHFPLPLPQNCTSYCVGSIQASTSNGRFTPWARANTSFCQLKNCIQSANAGSILGPEDL